MTKLARKPRPSTRPRDSHEFDRGKGSHIMTARKAGKKAANKAAAKKKLSKTNKKKA